MKTLPIDDNAVGVVSGDPGVRYQEACGGQAFPSGSPPGLTRLPAKPSARRAAACGARSRGRSSRAGELQGAYRRDAEEHNVSQGHKMGHRARRGSPQASSRCGRARHRAALSRAATSDSRSSSSGHRHGSLGVSGARRALPVMPPCPFLGILPGMDITGARQPAKDRASANRSTATRARALDSPRPTRSRSAERQILDHAERQAGQASNTCDMLWDLARLIEFASGFYTMRPGDVFFTGTTAGVNPIKRATSS